MGKFQPLHQLSLSQALGIVNKANFDFHCRSPYIGPLWCGRNPAGSRLLSPLDSFLRVLGVAFVIISLYGLLSGFGTNLGFAYVNFPLPFIINSRGGAASSFSS